MTKKKSLIAMMIMLISFIFLLAVSGCGKDSPAKLTGVYLTQDGSNEQVLNLDLGSYVYGSQPTLNYNVYATYSDNSTKKLEELIEGITLKYYYEYDGSSAEITEQQLLATNKDSGRYIIEYSLENGTKAQVIFEIEKSANITYNLTLNKTSWKVGESTPTLSLNGIEIGTEGLRYLTKDKYDEYLAKSEAEKQAFLLDLNNSSFVSTSMSVGSYYAFAVVPATKNYLAKATNIIQVNVLKADLTKSETGNLPVVSTYNYFANTTGDITLSDLEIGFVFNEQNQIEFRDPFGNVVLGKFEWSNPDLKINSTSTGEYDYEFVPNEGYENYNNYAMGKLSIDGKIVKAHHFVPSLTEDQNFYTGTNQTVVISNYTQGTVVKVNGTVVNLEFNNNGQDYKIVGYEFKEVGSYQITIDLVDKTNHVWVNSDGEIAGTSQIILNYTINKMPSHFYFGTVWGSSQELTNGVVKLDITDLTADQISPCQNLAVSLVDYETDNNTKVEGTAQIVSEGNKTYFVLTVSKFLVKNGESFVEDTTSTSIGLKLHFTATGINNYENVDVITDALLLTRVVAQNPYADAQSLSISGNEATVTELDSSGETATLIVKFTLDSQLNGVAISLMNDGGEVIDELVSVEVLSVSSTLTEGNNDGAGNWTAGYTFEAGVEYYLRITYTNTNSAAYMSFTFTE